MEKINCIFCNHGKAQQVIYENDYFGKQCNDCNLIYISPRPTIKEIFDIYGHDQAHLSADTHIQGSYLKRLYARHTLGLIKRYCTQGEMLEIGSGGGYFLDEARKIGFKPHAIELNTAQAAFIKNNLNIPCQEKPFCHNSFGEKKFDILYHCDVISHLHDPIDAFKIMYSKLQKNGYLVFETGNIGDIDKTYYELFPAFQYPDHLFFFTQENLINLLNQTGFTVKKVYAYSIIPHLTLLKWLQAFVKSTAKTKSSTKKDPYLPSKPIGLLKKIYYQGLCFLRYKLGRIMPKKNRPQTLIIIAQKL